MAEAAHGHLRQTVSPKLGIPVLEVLDAKGVVAESYPSQKQLDAYATAGTSKPNTVSSVA